jgi:glutamyl-tRNA(Gln) amidotransferase subunit E
VEEKDAFVLVVDEREKALKALEIIKERACQALYGIPKETRGANEDGTTRYLRPQPGAARMYPETDVPPIKIDETILREAEKLVPPPIEIKMEELTKVYDLSIELAKQLLYSEYLNIFEELIKLYKVEPKVIATLLTSILGELRSEGLDLSVLEDRHLHMIAKLIESYGIKDKEVLKNIISLIIKNPGISYEELKNVVAETRISEDEVRRIVRIKIGENLEVVKARGEKAFQFIMGKVMAELRGRIDGKTVASIVKEELAKIFKSSV